MKPVKTILALVAASFSASAAYYQLEATVDVKLTGTYAQEMEPLIRGTKKTSSAVVKTFRITNKELLNELVQDGTIEDASGWKIMSVGDEYGESIVLRKSGMEDIYLNIQLAGEIAAHAYSYREVYDLATDRTLSDSGKWTSVGSGDFQVGSLAVTFTGKQTGSDTYKYMKDSEQEFWIDGAVTTTLMGTAQYGPVEDAAEGIVVEGTIIRGAQKTVNVSEPM